MRFECLRFEMSVMSSRVRIDVLMLCLRLFMSRLLVCIDFGLRLSSWLKVSCLRLRLSIRVRRMLKSRFLIRCL